MRVTMVKKRLADGSWCTKCGEAEELLRNRKLWQRIDRVAVADESDPDSAGWRLAAHFQVDVAPFFIVEDDGDKTAVYTSALQLVRAISPRPVRTRAGKHAVLDDTAVSRFSSLFAEKHPQKCIKWALETFGRDCSIAFSGAEDVVLIDMASRTGLDFSVFVLDTGRLHPETYRFIEDVRKRYRIELDVMSPDGPILEAFVRAKGLFSFYDDGHQECCGIRKVEPLRRALKIRPAWITGQRRDQSPTRAEVATVEFDPTFKGAGQDGQLVKVNPLAVWTEQQVWDYIRAFELPYNPLHEQGFRSIGCAPCTRATHPGQHPREGRWWWEEATTRECGLHMGNLRQKVGAEDA